VVAPLPRYGINSLTIHRVKIMNDDTKRLATQRSNFSASDEAALLNRRLRTRTGCYEIHCEWMNGVGVGAAWFPFLSW
jgi:hypothetical protein